MAPAREEGAGRDQREGACASVWCVGAVALAFRNDVLGDYSTVVSKVLHVPVAPHIILSHTLLEDSLGWEILYRRGEVRVPGGGILKIHHASGG